MNPTRGAVRAGFSRGFAELRQTFTTPQDLWSYLYPAVILLVAMLFMRGAEVPGTKFSLGTAALPGVLGMNIAFSGLIGVAQLLTIEREDGTLLRVKSVPHGMLGYLIGKIILVSGMMIVSCLLVLVPGAFLLDGLAAVTAGSWLWLLVVLLFGMAATMPIGAIIGSLFSSPRSMGFIIIPIMGMVGISGIFYPVTQLPVLLQWIAQVFPMYWLGLGMRSALLPDSQVAVEIAGSWRHLETLRALGVWAVIGLVLAPIILRRMARRESGASVAVRRERAMQRAM